MMKDVYPVRPDDLVSCRRHLKTDIIRDQQALQEVEVLKYRRQAVSQLEGDLTFSLEDRITKL